MTEKNVSAQEINSGNKANAFILSGVTGNEEVLWLTYSNYKNGDTGITFYSIKNKKTLSRTGSKGQYPIINDIDDGFPFMPTAAKGDMLYYAVPAEWFVLFRDEYKGLKDFPVTEDENPIIMIATIKDEYL